MSSKRFNVNTFRRMKANGEKIVMLTSYDAMTAAIAERAGIDLLLVGDSMATTVLGYRNTLALTLEESLFHAKAVRRGAPNAFIVGDMPFMTFQADPFDALTNAARYLREADSDAVKIEGGEPMLPLIEKLVGCGIPVMGHIGLLPQKVLTSGGYKIAGRGDDAGEQLIAEAKRVESAGAFAVVLECMPAQLAGQISESISIPTIGIGGGIDCDGQVQVITDLLGIGDFIPKHAKCYGEVGKMMENAIQQYIEDVRTKKFPGEAQSF